MPSRKSAADLDALTSGRGFREPAGLGAKVGRHRPLRAPGVLARPQPRGRPPSEMRRSGRRGDAPPDVHVVLQVLADAGECHAPSWRCRAREGVLVADAGAASVAGEHARRHRSPRAGPRTLRVSRPVRTRSPTARLPSIRMREASVGATRRWHGSPARYREVARAALVARRPSRRPDTVPRASCSSAVVDPALRYASCAACGSTAAPDDVARTR